MPPKKSGAKKPRRREKKNIAHAHAHIKSSFNNTIVTITTPWRRMVLHFSQIFLTDGLTFMSLPTCTGR